MMTKLRHREYYYPAKYFDKMIARADITAQWPWREYGVGKMQRDIVWFGSEPWCARQTVIEHEKVIVYHRYLIHLN